MITGRMSIACVAALALIVPRTGSQGSQVTELVRAARTLEHFEGERLLYDPDFALPRTVHALVAAASTETLEQLLAHEDGSVRTLAIAGLYLELGPQALPYLLPLADDGGAAPQKRIPYARRPADSRPEPTEPQTVGEIARRLVEFHLEAAGYRGGIEGRRSAAGFDSYWKERSDRSSCLSWWSIALGRAARSTKPTPEDRLGEVAALRREIDRLPEVERAWVLLALCAPWDGGGGEPGARELASEEDLVQAGLVLREHGLLLALLRGEPLGSADPDVRLEQPTAFPYQRVATFVLRHAPELLSPEVEAELLALEDRHLSGQAVGEAPACITSRWSIAAADLRPDRARETLHRALGLYAKGEDFRSQDYRCFLAQALWRHGGGVESGTIVDWFFAEEPQRGAFGFGRHRFADWLAEPEQRELLRTIARDPGTEGLDWQTLRRLAESANRSNGREVVSRDELRGASHPLGEGHYHWRTAEEGPRYRVETAALEATLARWRVSLADWAD